MTISDSAKVQRLLVLDDESVIRELVADVARQSGFDVLSAQNTDAAGVVPIEQFDVVVLDLMMPHLDGIEILRMLAKAGSRAQLILMSGMDRRVLDTARKIAEEQGLLVAALLSKPFRHAELKSILDKKVAQPQSPEPGRTGRPQVTLQELHQALDEDQLVLHFQPKVRLPDLDWCGLEALVRWDHPRHGLLYPDTFITLAEHPDIALDFTYAVLRQAVAIGKIISDSAGFTGSISINLPPAALWELTFPERVVEIIDGSGLERSRVLLEVTETSIPLDLAVSLDIQTRLHMRDVRLSIDDFGTGHSSLERLQDAPFAELKIDRVFVRHMTRNTSSRMIVEGAIRLGHSLDMVVVAEGVEDEQTQQLLARLGCDVIQGFLVARPLPLVQLLAWAARRTVPAQS